MSDISTTFGDAYTRSAPLVLGKLHAVLLDNLGSHFQSEYNAGSNRNLLIVGPGGSVLPYSHRYNTDGTLGDTNRDLVKELIKNGKIVLMDYVLEESKNGLDKAGKSLYEAGFFQEGYFETIPTVLSGEILKLDQHKPNSISMIVNNLKDTIRIRGQFDAIDATLSVHHASVTIAELERVYREFYELLRPGGMLHLGEGNVDMNYTEYKIVNLGNKVVQLLNENLLVTDRRDASHILRWHFTPNEEYLKLPMCSSDEAQSNMVIDHNGIITISPRETDTARMQRFTEILANHGYLGKLAANQALLTSLIDPTSDIDLERYIKPVNEYYNAIIKNALAYASQNKDLFENIKIAIEYERKIALKGVVEHYMGDAIIIKALTDVGFKDIKKIEEADPFYNITAIKP